MDSRRPYHRGRNRLFIFDPFEQLCVEVRQRALRKGKAKVVYAFALGDIEAFIVGSDCQFVFYRHGVDIVNVFQKGQSIHGDYPFGELVEDRRVRLQVDASAGDQDVLIDTDEFRMRQPPGGPRLSELGVGEGQPDLGDFRRVEIRRQFIDVGTQEGGVRDLFFQAFFGADVDAVAFHVYAEEIMLGIHFGQSDGIFAFPAGELQGEGVGVFEKDAPLPGHAFRVLEDVGEGFDRFETDEFFLAHEAKVTKSGRLALLDRDKLPAVPIYHFFYPVEKIKKRSIIIEKMFSKNKIIMIGLPMLQTF
jgi:hypothetical protein